MRIAIIFGNDGTDPRIIRTCRSLLGMGHEVHFIGWNRRQEGVQRSVEPGLRLSILEQPVPYGHSTLGAQWRFTVHVLRQLARIRPDIVCAANEENAFRVLPLRGLLYKRLVCDVIDNQMDVFSNRSWPFRVLVAAICHSARLASDTLIATDQARYEHFGHYRYKSKVIGNYPEDPGDVLWRQWPQGPTQLYVAGTLTESRGLRQLLAALEGMPDVQITAAGLPSDSFATDTFIRHPQVSFKGYVPLEQNLKYAASADAVFAFYAPNCRNNILASPTKLYEAMSVGRPVLINSEAQVSQWVRTESLGYTCPYEDSLALRQLIRQLPQQRRLLMQTAATARQLFKQAYSWESMERILAEIYGCENELKIVQGDRRKAA